MVQFLLCAAASEACYTVAGVKFYFSSDERVRTVDQQHCGQGFGINTKTKVPVWQCFEFKFKADRESENIMRNKELVGELAEMLKVAACRLQHLI